MISVQILSTIIILFNHVKCVYTNITAFSSTSPHKLNILDELQNMRTDSMELLEDPEDVNTEVLPLNLLDNLKKKLE